MVCATSTNLNDDICEVVAQVIAQAIKPPTTKMYYHNVSKNGKTILRG